MKMSEKQPFDGLRDWPMACVRAFQIDGHVDAMILFDCGGEVLGIYSR